jgi:hypothetical protein
MCRSAAKAKKMYRVRMLVKLFKQNKKELEKQRIG